MELKRATSFEEQVELLRKKDLIIDDPDDCMAFLSRVNYYRLSGYFLPFIRKDTERCFFPTPIDRIYHIYNFDTELRNLISLAIERIETYMRTQLSYYHGHKYGPTGYLDQTSYNERHNHDSFIQHVESCIDENAGTLIVRHHKKNYDGKLPIWVIVDFFSVGMISYFYRGMINKDKSEIASSLYGVNYQTLDSWLRCLTDLRNRCAHYSRLYYWIFPAIPKMPTGEKYIPTRRLFAQLYMLKFMTPDKLQWKSDFVEPLEKLIEKYKPYISLKHLDFPDNWKSMLTE